VRDDRLATPQLHDRLAHLPHEGFSHGKVIRRGDSQIIRVVRKVVGTDDALSLIGK